MMVRLSNLNDPDEFIGRSVIDAGWQAEKRREEQRLMFDGIIKDFITADCEYATVRDIDVLEAVAGLQEAITRLGLDDDIEAYEDVSVGEPRVLLEKM